MKYLVIISLFVVFAFVGCSKKDSNPEQSEKTAVVDSVTQEISQLKQDIEYLKEELNEYHSYLEKDPNFSLYLMDRDLEITEQGGLPYGSFTDYFLPNAAAAFKAGASKKEINIRLDKLIALAEKGKYLSSYVGTLMEDGGPAAIRDEAEYVFNK